MSTVAFVPPEEDWAGDKDRGEGANEDTDDKDKCEVVDHTRTEDIKLNGRQQCGDRSEQGARENSADRKVYDRAQISAWV